MELEKPMRKASEDIRDKQHLNEKPEDLFKKYIAEKFNYLVCDITSRKLITLDRVRLFELFVKIADHYYPSTILYYDLDNPTKRYKGKHLEKVVIKIRSSKLYNYGT